MKRRILLEVDVDDGHPGAMLKVLQTLQNALNTERSRNTLIRWGMALMAPKHPEEKIYLVPIETLDVPEED